MSVFHEGCEDHGPGLPGLDLNSSVLLCWMTEAFSIKHMFATSRRVLFSAVSRPVQHAGRQVWTVVGLLVHTY